MSIVSQYILIKGGAKVEVNDVLHALGLTDYVPEKDVMLYETNKAKTLFIGQYNDVLIITHPDLPFDFFAEKQSETERKLIQLFPTNEIAVLLENEQVGAFGYAIIEQGVKVRMKDGADGEFYNDYGSLLPEELIMQGEILRGEIMPEDEIEELREDMSEEEVTKHIEFEACWRTPGLIAKRYFDGQTLNNMLGSDTKVTRFIKQ